MIDEDDKDINFLKRWSDRKTALGETRPDEKLVIREQGDVVHPIVQEEPKVDELEVPSDLPDIETLTKDSDFSLFMREGTPEHLKKLALKKLFNSDPAFSVLDGLNDYDEDYSMIGMVAEAVSTRYKPGHGIVAAEDEKNSDQEAANIPNETSSELDTKQEQSLEQDEGADVLEDLDRDNEKIESNEENDIEPQINS